MVSTGKYINRRLDFSGGIELMNCIAVILFTLFAGWIVYGIYLLEVDRDKARAKRKEKQNEQ